MELNIEEIQAILPHRPPFLLVDKITDYVPGEWAKGIKAVTVNEPFFVGHFPQYHVMPGVLIIEALAQVGAAAVLSLPEHRGKIGFLGAVKNARFRRQVTPGDVLTLTCTILREKAGVAQAEAVAEVDGQPAVTAELTFALRRDG